MTNKKDVMTKKIEGMATLEEDENGKVRIEFAPGAFDQFEGTQEELDEMIAEIQRIFESGEFKEMSQPIDIDELMETDPVMAEKIIQSLVEEEINEDNRKLH
jgi:hypothetical protein